MSREIKFRAWDGAKFIYFSPMTLIVHAAEDDEDSIFSSPIRELYELIRKGCFKPQRFVGLRDKTGKEIYERDIAVAVVKEIGLPIKGEVIFVGAAFQLKSEISAEPLWLEALDHLEVIGNIYESPELLEKA